jgi:hypothetical protein
VGVGKVQEARIRRQPKGLFLQLVERGVQTVSSRELKPDSNLNYAHVQG